MSNASSVTASASVFRVDTFVVPADALPTFIEQVRRIQQMLSSVPGRQQNLVLTQTEGSREFNVMTLVGWVSTEAMVAAKAVMQGRYAEEGFDPPAFMQRLGVRANIGLYREA